MSRLRIKKARTENLYNKGYIEGVASRQDYIDKLQNQIEVLEARGVSGDGAIATECSYSRQPDGSIVVETTYVARSITGIQEFKVYVK